MKLERDYQPLVIKRLRLVLPEPFILKNDASYMQGVPDLTVLCQTWWGVLETKRKMPTKASDYEPNQEFYIAQLNGMSFSAMICPENEEEVFDALQRSFQSQRSSRISKRKLASLG